MAAKRHLNKWKWIMLMMLCYIRYSFATETAIVMTKSPAILYKAELNANSPDVERLADLSAITTRCVYNKFTKEIVWGEGSLIKKLSVKNGGTPSTIRAFETVRDVALDSMTGHIMYSGFDTIYSMTPDGQMYRLRSVKVLIQSITVDAVNRQICFCSPWAQHHCIDIIIGVSNVKWHLDLRRGYHCKWLSYHDGYLYWIHSGTINRGAVFSTHYWPRNYLSVFSDKKMDYFTLFGNYIYGVSTADPNLYKININNVKDVTTFDLGLNDMAFVAVYETPKIKCPTSVPNGRLPYYCKALSGESCDDYTCNRGYRRNVSLVSLTCTESGNWNHNVSSLCLEIRCSMSIPFGRLPSNCKGKGIFDEACDDYTCDKGYRRSGTAVPLTCTESSNWNHNVSSLCLEIKCPTSIPNGRLPFDCNAIVDETCDNYTCDRGYQRNGTVVALTCTESGNWNHNESSLCLEIKCPASIPNGRLPFDCNAIVDETCDNYTCDRGYQRNGTVVALTCTESGNWNHNESSLCLELKTSVNPDIKTTVVIVIIASSIVIVVASSIVLVVKKWKHISKRCCGENNTEDMQLQREDYLHAVYSLENRMGVDQVSIASTDHYDIINDQLPEDEYYLTIIGALRDQYL